VPAAFVRVAIVHTLLFVFCIYLLNLFIFVTIHCVSYIFDLFELVLDIAAAKMSRSSPGYGDSPQSGASPESLTSASATPTSILLTKIQASYAVFISAIFYKNVTHVEIITTTN
jgi:hypothetical protein